MAGSEDYARTQPRSHRYRNDLSNDYHRAREKALIVKRAYVLICARICTRRPRLEVKQPRKKEAEDGVGKRDRSGEIVR